MRPARMAARSCQLFFNPLNPWTHTPVGRNALAACEVFERTTRRYRKPAFGLTHTLVDRASVRVSEEVVWEHPFCRLIHFKRDIDPRRAAADPRLLLVAPMSGHFATLLRGTVETLLPDHEVYITDWEDARDVPLADGRFDLDDYIDIMMDIFRHLGGDVHVFAVCQPAVPVLAATAVMEANGEPQRAAVADPGGRAGRHAHQPDGRQYAGRGARHRLVPPQRHHHRAVGTAGPRAQCLPRLPAAVGLHDHEPRPPHAGAQGHVPPPRARRRRLRPRSTAPSTTSTWR